MPASFFEEFASALIADGWQRASAVHFTKGSWVILCDTSTWIEIGTTSEERVFDIPVPQRDKIQWTLNLIDHLLRTHDALRPLKGRDQPG